MIKRLISGQLKAIWTHKFTIIVSVLLFIAVAVLILNALIQSKWSRFIDFGTGFQNLPNYLMFVGTLFTAYLLWLTISTQISASKLDSFESRFFRFIDYHRENVLQLEYKSPKDKKEKYFKGNQVFTVIHYEIRDLLKEFYENSRWDASNTLLKRKAINFVYQCVFYGAGEDGLRVLESRFSDNEYFDFIDFKEKFAAYSKSKQPQKYYSGHIRRLGHYFRNLYQAIQYLEDQKIIDDDHKYEYVAHLRAQMSVYEQCVFFFNSLSALGDSWEWDVYDDDSHSSYVKRKRNLSELLITKYDLVRNTLNNDGFITESLSIKQFYPLINLEREEECTVFGILPLSERKSICRYCLNTKYFGFTNKAANDKIRIQIRKSTDSFKDFSCAEPKCRTTKMLKRLKNQAI